MILIPTIENTGTHFIVSLFGTEIDVSRRYGFGAFESLRPDIQEELLCRLSGRKDGIPGSDSGALMIPANIRLNGGPLYDVVFEHIPSQLSLMLRLGVDNPMVIPLRHPKVVAESWKARGQEEKRMCADFRTLVEKLNPLNPYYLPIDSDRRQEFLDKINDGLGLNLETDWKPIGEQKGNSHLRHDAVDCSPVVAKLCEEIKPFLDRFYD